MNPPGTLTALVLMYLATEGILVHCASKALGWPLAMTLWATLHLMRPIIRDALRVSR